jgi:multiple antibiotic resistance protein
MFNLKEIFTAGMILFAVIDIIGSIPIIIELKKKVGYIQSEKASAFSVILMIAFLFIGEEILNIIGIDVNSFAVAGALVIFFISLEMVLGISIYKNETPETASIVPIAFPFNCRCWNTNNTTIAESRISTHKYYYCNYCKHSFCLFSVKIFRQN